MTAPIVIIAIGNPSRGDDAIGPTVCGELEKWREMEKRAEDVELIEDFQLNIEHALDLQGRQAVIFVDAGAHTPGPFTFTRIAPSAIPSHTSHALPPEAVLQVYRQVVGGEPPASYVLCIRGECFELGAPLGAVAQSGVQAALAFLRSTLSKPPQTWQAESGHPS